MGKKKIRVERSWSSSAQEQESQSMQEKFKEKQEVQKNNFGNANGSKQNHSTGLEVVICKWYFCLKTSNSFFNIRSSMNVGGK